MMSRSNRWILYRKTTAAVPIKFQSFPSPRSFVRRVFDHCSTNSYGKHGWKQENALHILDIMRNCLCCRYFCGKTSRVVPNFDGIRRWPCQHSLGHSRSAIDEFHPMKTFSRHWLIRICMRFLSYSASLEFIVTCPSHILSLTAFAQWSLFFFLELRWYYIWFRGHFLLAVIRFTRKKVVFLDSLKRLEILYIAQPQWWIQGYVKFVRRSVRPGTLAGQFTPTNSDIRRVLYRFPEGIPYSIRLQIRNWGSGWRNSLSRMSICYGSDIQAAHANSVGFRESCRSIHWISEVQW